MSEQDRRERLGEPGLCLGGFELWVHGRQFPESHDAWDGNWLLITARFASHDAVVWTEGPLLDTVGIAGFREGLDGLYRTLAGTAVLASVEPELSLRVEVIDASGHFRAHVAITPDIQNQAHWFEFEFDQTYLPSVIRHCDQLLRDFPVREPGGRGL